MKGVWPRCWFGCAWAGVVLVCLVCCYVEERSRLYIGRKEMATKKILRVGKGRCSMSEVVMLGWYKVGPTGKSKRQYTLETIFL